ncbi:MAG: hypothetical protein ACFFD4_02305 [Candidatus Odinarchaeota archaeon]
MRLGKREIDYLLQVHVLNSAEIRLALRNERLFELSRETSQGNVLPECTRQQNYRISTVLEEKGLVTRVSSDEDLRKVRVTVTKEGRDLITGKYHVELFNLLKKLLPGNSSPSEVANLLHAVFIDEFMEFRGNTLDREGTQDLGTGHDARPSGPAATDERDELREELRKMTAWKDELQETVNVFINITEISPEEAVEYSGLQKKIVFDNVSLLEGWKRKFDEIKMFKEALRVSQEARAEQARMLGELQVKIKELEKPAG